MSDKVPRLKLLLGKAENEITGNGAGQSHSVNGNNNVVIGSIGNVTHIETKKVVKKTEVITKPGEENITEEQACVLHRLVHEIVQTEKLVKRKPRSFQAVWLKLNRKFKVAQYRMIPLGKFAQAEKFLRMEIGRLQSAKSAPKKDVNWRNKRYAHNHTNAKKYNLYGKMREFMTKKWGVTSQKELTNEQLDQLYRAVNRWKREIEKTAF